MALAESEGAGGGRIAAPSLTRIIAGLAAAYDRLIGALSKDGIDDLLHDGV
jgi:hypothetical protein